MSSASSLGESQQAKGWGSSGLAYLTGLPDGPADFSRANVLTRAGEVAAAIGNRLGIDVDAASLLTGRAALLGLTRGGRVSPGGGTRLLNARDGCWALTLSRADDLDARASEYQLCAAWRKRGAQSEYAWRLQPAPHAGLAGTWTASSGFAWDHWPRSGSLRGHGMYGLLFHTEEEDRPWLRVDLGGEHELHHVILTNRSDCCGDRAVPLEVEVSLDGASWQKVATRQEPFETWTIDLPPQTRARYVRLQVQRRTLFHLRDVVID